MLQAIVVGNVGADAKYQSKDGRDFTTFRVAHNETWTDAAGGKHDTTVWVDCIMNGHPKVAEFIKAGTQVIVIGNENLRVYSSERDRCMKAGATINVVSVQLLGGTTDDVPKRLYDANGAMHEVKKAYYSDVKGCQLTSIRNEIYIVDDNGWITKQQGENSQLENNG